MTAMRYDCTTIRKAKIKNSDYQMLARIQRN